jgi:alkylation response protein AidB-like acyl-CoA dehydrogenase
MLTKVDHSVTGIPTPEQIVSSARALAPVLRSRSQAAELARQCPEETIADIRAAGITRIVQPRRFGGYGMDWDVLCEVAMELGAGCGGQAWACTVLSDHPCIAGMFSEQAQGDVWGTDPDVLISTSYGPRGSVERVSGGYKLSGRWMFSSGVVHSRWSIIGGFVDGGNGKKLHHFFLVPAADRKILDDWNVMGMAASGSNSFELKDAFVPEHRALDHRLVQAGDSPGASVNDEPLHRMPIIGYTGTVLVSVPIGIARGMVDDFAVMLREKAGSPPGKPGIEDMQLRLAEADAEVESARLLLLESARVNMAKLRSGQRLTETDGGRTARNSAYAAKLARQAAMRLFEVTGGSALNLGNHFQRSFRDIMGGTAHTTLNWGRCASRFSSDIIGWPAPAPF